MDFYNHFVWYPIGFIIGLIISMICTVLIAKIADRFSIVATTGFGTGSSLRVPLLGGLAIFIAFSLSLSMLWFYSDVSGDILKKHIIGFLTGGFVLMIGGFIDDKYNVSVRKQFIWPILAVLIVIISGIGITYITNPLKPDSLIYLNTIEYDVLWWGGLPYRFTLFTDVFTVLWLMGIMYATKLQDGLDGLVSGVSFIAAFLIFLMSLAIFNQMDLSLIAIVFSGVMLGFWYFNKYPARIYLGEGGSLFAGFMLGVMAILSDAKVVITIMILALPIIDVLWTVLRRIKRGHPPWQGDTEHLHHRLIKLGLTHRQAVLLLYSITILFGLLVLLWQSSFRFYFIGFIILIAFISAIIFRIVYRKEPFQY